MTIGRYYIGCGYHTNQTIVIYDYMPKRWEKLIPQLLRDSRATSSTTASSTSNTSGDGDKSLSSTRNSGQNQIVGDTNEVCYYNINE